MKHLLTFFIFSLIFLTQSSPQLDPEKPDVQFNTSLTHFQKGKEEQALKSFFEALNVSVSDREKELAIDGAIQDWNTLLKTKSSNAIYTTLWFLNKAKEQPTSKEMLSKMGTLDLEKYVPDQADSKLLYIMGAYFCLQNNFEKADEYLQKSYDIEGGWLIKAKNDSDYNFYFQNINYSKIGIETRIQEKNKKPKLFMQNGHTHIVDYIAYSPDGKTLATTSYDNTAKIWSKDGKLLLDIKGQKINHIIYSPDGKTLATTSHDNTAKIWSLDGKLLYNLIGHARAVNNIVYSPDGKTLATASDDKTAKIWNMEGKLLHDLKGHTGSIYQIVYSPDGKTLATASDDKTAKIWNMEGKLLYNLQAHTDSVTKIVYSPDGKILATGSEDKTVKIWNMEGKLMHDLKKHNGSIIAITFSPDGKTLATSCNDGPAQIWSINAKHLYTLKAHTKAVSHIAYSPNGETLVTASFDNTAKIWSLDAKLLYNLKAHTDSVLYATYSPDGKMLATASWDKTAKIWSIDGKLLHDLKGDNAFVHRVTYSPDGKFMATAFNNNTGKIWSIDGKKKHDLSGHADWIHHITYSPDGKTIATSSADKTAKIWNSEGILLHNLVGHTDWVEYITYSPDGKTLATASWDGTAKIWSIDGKLLYDLKGHSSEANHVTYSPNGKTLVTDSWDGTAKIWSSDGKLLHDLIGHSLAVTCSVYSPDGKSIATVSEDKTIKIWSSEGKLLRDIKDQPPVWNIQFSPDGNYLISISKKSDILVWKLGQNPSPIHISLSNSGGIFSLYFINNRQTLVTTSFDNTIKYWNWNSILNSLDETKMNIATVSDPAFLMATQMFFYNNSSIIYTPDNYYMVTDESALNYIAFKKDNKVYDFDQFDLKFNRPDIILERMKGVFLNQKQPDESNEDYQTRVADYENRILLMKNYYENRVIKNGFELKQLSGENKIHASEISNVKIDGKDALGKDFNFSAKNSKIKLSFQIQDEAESNLDVVGYKIFVKGVPIHGQMMKKFSSLQKTQTVEEEITLSTLADIGDRAGDNPIEIIGYTSDGIESNKYKFEMKYNFTGKKEKKLYLVTLGTEKYWSGHKSDLSDLSYSIDDAQDLQKLFLNENGKGKIYDSIVSLKFTEEEINRNAVKKIRDELSKTDVDDSVVFFISGHGVRADTPIDIANNLTKELGVSQSIGDLTKDKDKYNIYYYMTSNSNSKEPWGNGIPMESFRYALDGIKARQKILLIDTCQSGEILDLKDMKPSKQGIEEINKIQASYKGKEKERGITLVQDSQKYSGRLALEFELREISKLFPELRRGSGTIEISAASGTQSALESEKWKNGAFTFTIKEAILEGKAKSENTITAKSLRKYILERVERLTEGQQIPMVTRDIPGRDFMIIK